MSEIKLLERPIDLPDNLPAYQYETLWNLSPAELEARLVELGASGFKIAFIEPYYNESRDPRYMLIMERIY